MTTSTTARRVKQPQDHKKSQAEIQKAFDEVDGSQFLKPLKEIDGFQQMEIMAELESVVGGADGEDTEVDFKAFAKAIRPVLEGLIVDEAGFQEWNRGPGAMGRLLELAMALLGELGKGIGSASS